MATRTRFEYDLDEEGEDKALDEDIAMLDNDDLSFSQVARPPPSTISRSSSTVVVPGRRTDGSVHGNAGGPAPAGQPSTLPPEPLPKRSRTRSPSSTRATFPSLPSGARHYEVHYQEHVALQRQDQQRPMQGPMTSVPATSVLVSKPAAISGPGAMDSGSSPVSSVSTRTRRRRVTRPVSGRRATAAPVMPQLPLHTVLEAAGPPAHRSTNTDSGTTSAAVSEFDDLSNIPVDVLFDFDATQMQTYTPAGQAGTDTRGTDALAPSAAITSSTAVPRQPSDQSRGSLSAGAGTRAATTRSAAPGAATQAAAPGANGPGSGSSGPDSGPHVAPQHPLARVPRPPDGAGELQLVEVKAQIEKLTRENQDLKAVRMEQNGEVRVLRDRLKQENAERLHVELQHLAALKHVQEEKQQLEGRVKNESEGLKATLQFKEQELREMSSMKQQIEEELRQLQDTSMHQAQQRTAAEEESSLPSREVGQAPPRPSGRVPTDSSILQTPIHSSQVSAPTRSIAPNAGGVGVTGSPLVGWNADVAAAFLSPFVFHSSPVTSAAVHARGVGSTSPVFAPPTSPRTQSHKQKQSRLPPHAVSPVSLLMNERILALSGEAPLGSQATFSVVADGIRVVHRLMHQSSFRQLVSMLGDPKQPSRTADIHTDGNRVSGNGVSHDMCEPPPSSSRLWETTTSVIAGQSSIGTLMGPLMRCLPMAKLSALYVPPWNLYKQRSGGAPTRSGPGGRWAHASSTSSAAAAVPSSSSASGIGASGLGWWLRSLWPIHMSVYEAESRELSTSMDRSDAQRLVEQFVCGIHAARSLRELLLASTVCCVIAVQGTDRMSRDSVVAQSGGSRAGSESIVTVAGHRVSAPDPSRPHLLRLSSPLATPGTRRGRGGRRGGTPSGSNDGFRQTPKNSANQRRAGKVVHSASRSSKQPSKNEGVGSDLTSGVFEVGVSKRPASSGRRRAESDSGAAIGTPVSASTSATWTDSPHPNPLIGSSGRTGTSVLARLVAVLAPSYSESAPPDGSSMSGVPSVTSALSPSTAPVSPPSRGVSHPPLHGTVDRTRVCLRPGCDFVQFLALLASEMRHTSGRSDDEHTGILALIKHGHQSSSDDGAAVEWQANVQHIELAAIVLMSICMDLIAVLLASAASMGPEIRSQAQRACLPLIQSGVLHVLLSPHHRMDHLRRGSLRVLTDLVTDCQCAAAARAPIDFSDWVPEVKQDPGQHPQRGKVAKRGKEPDPSLSLLPHAVPVRSEGGASASDPQSVAVVKMLAETDLQGESAISLATSFIFSAPASAPVVGSSASILSLSRTGLHFCRTLVSHHQPPWCWQALLCAPSPLTFSRPSRTTESGHAESVGSCSCQWYWTDSSTASPSHQLRPSPLVYSLFRYTEQQLIALDEAMMAHLVSESSPRRDLYSNTAGHLPAVAVGNHQLLSDVFHSGLLLLGCLLHIHAGAREGPTTDHSEAGSAAQRIRTHIAGGEMHVMNVIRRLEEVGHQWSPSADESRPPHSQSQPAPRIAEEDIAMPTRDEWIKLTRRLQALILPAVSNVTAVVETS